MQDKKDQLSFTDGKNDMPEVTEWDRAGTQTRIQFMI